MFIDSNKTIVQIERDVKAQHKAQRKKRKIKAEDILDIEPTNDIPEDAQVEDGVEIEGDLSPEVEEKLNNIGKVAPPSWGFDFN